MSFKGCRGRTHTGNEIFGNVKAPLEGCDRATDAGFIKYYSQRPYHFQELFKYPWSLEVATIILNKRRETLVQQNRAQKGS